MTNRNIALVPDALLGFCNELLECPDCSRMSVSRQPPVCGYGKNLNGIMFVGQSPEVRGADVSGIPFTRDSDGRTFQQMLKDCRLNMDDCYSTYMVKFCTGYEKFRPEWIDHCRPHFFDEIQMVKPSLIVTFGLAYRVLVPDGNLRFAHGKLSNTIDVNGNSIDVFPFLPLYIYRKAGGFQADVENFKYVLKKYFRQRLLNETKQTTLEPSGSDWFTELQGQDYG